MRLMTFAVFVCVVSASCATTTWQTSADASAMTGTPAEFRPTETVAQAARGSAPCLNPLVDPRDGTRITLVRSSGGLGDYAVASGKYGVGAGQLLRVDCSDGRPMGVVEGER